MHRGGSKLHRGDARHCDALFLFVGPVVARPKLIRRGKSTVIVTVELEGETGMAVQAAIVFAGRLPRFFRRSPGTP
jgi:hypothetical protein